MIRYFFACTGNQAPDSRGKNQSDLNEQKRPASQVRIDTNSEKKVLSTPDVKTPKKIRKTVDDSKQPATSITPEINLTSVNAPYVNPNFNAWDAYFGSDPKWVALYQESIAHYLQGLAYNLEQNSTLQMERSMIVFVYGKKMEDAFMFTPEFAEYATIRFEKSTEFTAFVRTYSSRIIED
jgi:hypothetical protein